MFSSVYEWVAEVVRWCDELVIYCQYKCAALVFMHFFLLLSFFLLFIS